MAQHVVDELVQVTEEELANKPGMEALRQRLRLNCSWHITRNSSNNAFAMTRMHRRELLEAKARVERILADLAVLRSSTLALPSLLCQPIVLDELRLSSRPSQQGKGTNNPSFESNGPIHFRIMASNHLQNVAEGLLLKLAGTKPNSIPY